MMFFVEQYKKLKIVIKKFSEIINKETIEDFIQALVENGIRSIYEQQE